MADYLKPVEQCPECGANVKYAPYPADARTMALGDYPPRIPINLDESLHYCMEKHRAGNCIKQQFD